MFKESREYGYCPHSSQSETKCQKCGHNVFRTFPQGISVDAKVWCHEYVCAKCGTYLGIQVEREL